MAISKNKNDERKCEYCGYDEANIDGSHEEYAMNLVNGWLFQKTMAISK